jgi:hypothetical protein
MKHGSRPMRFWFIGLLFGVLPCSGEIARLTAPAVLYSKFQMEPPAAVMQSMREELAAIMGPVGIRIEWRSLSDVQGSDVVIDLAVITFKGRCDVSRVRPSLHNPGVLGYTHASDGVILPFANVDCDRIRGFIQRDLRMERADEREKVFGRAIARVLSHELYHIFAKTAKHTPCGVGKSAYFASELVSDTFHFEMEESAALRRTGENIADSGNGPPGPVR